MPGGDVEREQRQVERPAQSGWIIREVLQVGMLRRSRWSRWESGLWSRRSQGKDSRGRDGVGVDVEFRDGGNLSIVRQLWPFVNAMTVGRSTNISRLVDGPAHEDQLFDPQKRLGIFRRR